MSVKASTVVHRNLVTYGHHPAAYGTGGVVTEAGGYRIHTFLNDGNQLTLDTFGVVNAPLTVDILVVGGGGAGGNSTSVWGTPNLKGGGGGAGGVLHRTGVYVVAPVSVGIGVGGNRSYVVGNSGYSGVESAFGAYIAREGGGGGGGGSTSEVGKDGGSGGGSGRGFGSAQYGGGQGTVGQGHDGGGRFDAYMMYYSGGGGGGAGTQGAWPGVGSPKGDGGLGYLCDISGTPTYYGGGGGGGSSYLWSVDHWSYYAGLGGSGSGGDGAGQTDTIAYTLATDGVSNTGGGGGGGGSQLTGEVIHDSQLGGRGGSGIVIVRYLIQGQFRP
jgi:hypothetical protein